MRDAEDTDPASRKLVWRCRRGSRELDQFLMGFMRRRYHALGPDQQADFARLLDQQDPLITDWIWGRSPAPDDGLAAVVALIRADVGLG